MQDKTINSVLRHLYQYGEYSVNVAALLDLRGVDHPKVSTPRCPPFAKRELQRLIAAALQDGPQTGAQVHAYVAARYPDMPRQIVRDRLSTVLWKLKVRGAVRRVGRLWQFG